MVEFGFYGDNRFSGDFNDGIRQEPLPMDIIRNSGADLPPADDGIEPIVPGPERKREPTAEPVGGEATDTGKDTPALPEADIESVQDQTEGSSLEFVQFNDPDNRSHSQQTASTLDFLSRTVLGEKYDINFEPDEEVPLLYGIVDDGRLVAAASLSTGDEEYQLSLLGVAGDRRGEGLGTELLARVEEEVMALGGTKLTICAVGEREAKFYTDRYYTEDPDAPDHDTFIKYLAGNDDPET